MIRLGLIIVCLVAGSCSEAIEPTSDQSRSQRRPPNNSANADDGGLAGDATVDDNAPHDHSEKSQGTSTATATATSTNSRTSTDTSVNTATRTNTSTGTSTDTNVVEFRIREGTGRGPWNTRETMVTVKVGQTLKIVNDDSTVHRLHTGGAPCPHQPGPGIQKGEEFLCKVERTLNVGNGAPATYDHNVGPSAAFFVRAINK